MGLPNETSPFALGSTGGYQIEQSLRFNSGDSPYLVKTFSSSPASTTTQTFSWWVKLLNADGLNQFPGLYGRDGTSEGGFSYRNTGDSVNPLGFRVETGAARITTSAKYRDYSAWYHIVMVYDTNNGTSTDRMRLYVNGERIDAFAGASYPSSGQNTRLLSTNSNGNLIGSYATDSNYGDFYLAEFHGVDGQALTHEDFGEFDNNGVWRPIAYTGSHGTNGFYLTFDPTATNGIGHDHSDNGNNWTANNFTTSGTGTDVMSDTPTTNYATLNPLDTPDVNPTLSEGNLKWVTNTSLYTNQVRSSIYYPTSGKWYTEVTIENFNTGSGLGYADIGLRSTDAGANVRYLWWVYSSSEVQINTDSGLQNVGSVSVNDVIQVAYDASTGKLWFGKNNTWYLSGDPANGTAMSSAATISSASGNTVFYISGRTGSDTNRVIANFGQRDFAYTPPTGFNALNTRNLSAPTVKDGSDYFNTVLYGGNNGTLTVTGLGFSPDLVWIKNREVNGAGHAWQDQVRGATAFLFSNSTASENTDTANDWFRDFTSDGFTVAATTTGGTASSEWNNNGSGYVAWCWDAGGSGSSNTDGSITSTVSANPSAGFSISTFTASTFAIETIGHGLGVAPSLIIVKKRSATEPWYVWHKDFTVSQYLRLNDASSLQTSSNLWGTSPPSSTVFGYYPTVGDHVAYCFAEVPGYSSIGSYVGNGNDDGPFLYTGFRPSFLLYRRTDSGQPWYILDSSRNTYNPFDNLLAPDLTDAEDSATIADFLSNGVKLRNSLQTSNASGGSYIYMAFAEHPLGGDGVSPATAR
jgi:hypothetical protein